jgi:Cys-rich protein (TIGR01571 family)
MHRLKLTWYGSEASNIAESCSTFRIMFWIGVFWIVLRLSQYVLPMTLADENGVLGDGAGMIIFIFNVLLLAIFAFYLLIMCKTRRYIREKYQIPEQQCHGCEDCCCVYWCSCCTVAQMARHTGDYKAHGARWCSETGLHPGAPSIV